MDLDNICHAKKSMNLLKRGKKRKFYFLNQRYLNLVVNQ